MDHYKELDLNWDISCDTPLGRVFEHTWHSKIEACDLQEIDDRIRHEVGLTLSSIDNVSVHNMTLILYKSKEVSA